MIKGVIIVAQETWGLKLDSELKEKLQSIIKEDFENSKDFMESLIGLYELNKIKKGENILIAEVEELEQLTNRINMIFINANARLNTMLRDKDIKADEQQQYKDRMIERLQGDITRLEEEKVKISNINDELVNVNQEHLNQINQLTKANQTLEELVAEYKEKNDTLTGTLTEYKIEHENNKMLQDKVRNLEVRVNELNIVSEKQAQTIIEYDEIKKEQELKLNQTIDDLKVKHADEIETLKARADIELNKKILDIQQQDQIKIQALQEKHNQDIEQYQNKYKELLEKIETKKRVTNNKPKETKEK